MYHVLHRNSPFVRRSQRRTVVLGGMCCLRGTKWDFVRNLGESRSFKGIWTQIINTAIANSLYGGLALEQYWYVRSIRCAPQIANP
jgi:hypothetical protein